MLLGEKKKNSEKLIQKKNEFTRLNNLHNIRCHEYDVTIDTRGYSQRGVTLMFDAWLQWCKMEYKVSLKYLKYISLFLQMNYNEIHN